MAEGNCVGMFSPINEILYLFSVY